MPTIPVYRSPCATRRGPVRSVFTHAVPPDVDLSGVDSSLILEQLSQISRSAVDTTYQLSENIQTAVGPQLSEFSSKAVEASSELISELTRAIDEQNLTDQAAEQITAISEQASEISASLISKSSDVSSQISSAVSEQMSLLPEYQARARELADTLLTDLSGVSSQTADKFENELYPKLSAEIESFSALTAAGAYGEAASSPAGIAIASSAALLLATTAASSSSPSTSSSSPPAPLPSPEENKASAQAWIAQWRASNTATEPEPEAAVPRSLPRSFSPNGSSLNGASLNGAAPSSNGTAAANGDGSHVTDSPVPIWGATDSAEASAEMEAAATALKEAVEKMKGGSAPGDAAHPGTAVQPEVEEVDQAASVVTQEAPAAAAQVELRYHSGWEAAVIHACVAGGEWMSAPMERDPETGVLTWRAALVADAPPFEGGGVAEFVITDGAGDWDKRPDGCNYALPGQGVFELRDGELVEVS